MQSSTQTDITQAVNWDDFCFDSNEVLFCVGSKRLRSIEAPVYPSAADVFDRLCLGGEPYAYLRQIIGEAVSARVSELSANIVSPWNDAGNIPPVIEIRLDNAVVDGEELINRFNFGAAERVAQKLSQRLGVCQVSYSSNSEQDHD